MMPNRNQNAGSEWALFVIRSYHLANMARHLTFLNFGVSKAQGDPLSQRVFAVFVHQIYEENTALRDTPR